MLGLSYSIGVFLEHSERVYKGEGHPLLVFNASGLTHETDNQRDEQQRQQQRRHAGTPDAREKVILKEGTPERLQGTLA